jgi:chemotaxis signal transduction protein
LLQLVSFKIGNEEFGLDILRVQEIIHLCMTARESLALVCGDGSVRLVLDPGGLLTWAANSSAQAVLQ